MLFMWIEVRPGVSNLGHDTVQGFWKKLSLLIELLGRFLLKIQLKVMLFFQKPCITLIKDLKQWNM